MPAPASLNGEVQMATQWIMVRLDTSTHAALERVRESMLLGEEMGLTKLAKDDRERVSLTQVITRLIAFRDRHAARARRSKARRRKAAKEHALMEVSDHARERDCTIDARAGIDPGLLDDTRTAGE
jgi:hypothetical protein